MNLNKKIERMNKINELEETILLLEKWEIGVKSEKLEAEFGTVENYEHRDKLIMFIMEYIENLRDEEFDSDKLYLSEIIEKEKPSFENNNLILSPVGSGKSTLIENVLLKDKKGKILMLVSNTALKDAVCPDDNEIKVKEGKNMYTSQNKKRFGVNAYSIHVMSYAEFGARIKYKDDFAEKFIQIYCDEIHSLIEYEDYSESLNLTGVIKYLFKKHENQQVFYFTATQQSLVNFGKKFPGILSEVKIFDYLEHPNIKKYVALSQYEINHIEQIRPHLKARKESFDYFGYKCLAFSKTISGMKKIEEIAIDEGYKPISIWSINNDKEEFQMTEEQLKVRKHLLEHGEIPEPYNVLIINSAMQEGWNLYDKKVRLAIMNTTNETTKIQALGRYRNDIEILICRTKQTTKDRIEIILSEKWLGTPLSTEMKEELCQELKIVNKDNQIYKWFTVSKMLEKQGYIIKNEILRENGRRLRMTYILKPE